MPFILTIGKPLDRKQTNKAWGLRRAVLSAARPKFPIRLAIAEIPHWLSPCVQPPIGDDNPLLIPLCPFFACPLRRPLPPVRCVSIFARRVVLLDHIMLWVSIVVGVGDHSPLFITMRGADDPAVVII